MNYKMRFFRSLRVMSNSLSSCTNNLSDRLHKDKCKDCKPYLEYMKVKDGSLIFRYLSLREKHEKEFD